MAILNPSFEDEGALPGEAANWTLTAVTSLQEIAGFDTDPEDPHEGFERWFPLFRSLDDVPVVIGFFNEDVDGREHFGTGWQNDGYLLELASATTEPCLFSGTDDHESFEGGWSNDSYAYDWTFVASIFASFTGLDQERFGTQWKDNQNYAFTWDDVTPSQAMFDGGASTVESFSGTWTAL